MTVEAARQFLFSFVDCVVAKFAAFFRFGNETKNLSFVRE